VHLQRLELRGVRALADRAFDLAAPGARLDQGPLFITGGPASGKTTLLEAIIAASEGVYPTRPADDDLVRNNSREATIVAHWRLTPAEAAAVGADSGAFTRVGRPLQNFLMRQGSARPSAPRRTRKRARAPNALTPW
jgi:recombinational DNA repair ATPase RecF